MPFWDCVDCVESRISGVETSDENENQLSIVIDNQNNRISLIT